MADKKNEEYSEEETQLRFEAALRGARMVGHKPQSEMKLGNNKQKRKKSPQTKRRATAKR